MKAIAEYFRDLAAEDRYFGAEPPQPDTEMLARIAEKEIRTRVEARIENDNNVVLRAHPEAPATAIPARTKPAAEAAPAPAAPLATEAEPARETPAQEIAQTAFPAGEADETALFPAGDEEGGESVAEKLKRIREVVSRARAGSDGTIIPAAMPAVDDAVVDAEEITAAGEAAEDAVAGEAAQEESAEESASVEPLESADETPQEAAAEVEAEAEAESDEAEADTVAGEEIEAEAGAETEAVAEAEAETAPLEEPEAESEVAEASEEPEAAREMPEAPVEEHFAEEEKAFAEEEATEEAAEADLHDVAEHDVAEDEAEDDDLAMELADRDVAPHAESGETGSEEDIAEDVLAEAEEEADEFHVAQEDLADEETIAQAPLETAAQDLPQEEHAGAFDDEDADTEENDVLVLSDQMQAGDTEEGPPETPDELESGSTAEETALDKLLGRITAQSETGEAHPDEVDEDTATGDDGGDDILVLDDTLEADQEAMAEEEHGEEAAAETDEAELPDSEELEEELEALYEDVALDEGEYIEGPQDNVFADETAHGDDVIRSIRSSLEDEDISPEDEADLMAELEEAEDEALPGLAGRDHIRRTLLENEEVDEEAERILDETNQQFDAPEGSRRRSAISHLRAAVAATVADRLMRGGRSNDKKKGEDEADQYREDLAKVITPARPKRPARPAKRKGSGRTARKAPLVLVSEQRIDEESTAQDAAEKAPVQPVRPVRPRRTRKGNLAVKEAPEIHEEADLKPTRKIAAGFAKFAAEMGVGNDPADILEAAAAYICLVEGQAQFTRPELMACLEGHEAGALITREEKLRMFGQLQREGRIVRISRGVFMVAKNTRFQPNSRIAGE